MELESAATGQRRRLELGGPVNFRDVGGYPTADGRSVRWGRVYRSDSLGRLAPADLERFAALGVARVCDLRMDAEREAEPSRVEGRDGVVVEHLPIGGVVAQTRSMGRLVREGKITEVTVERMAAVYEELLEAHPSTFGAVVARAADPADLPLVIHCTAGKDRTGIAVALILAALGVEEASILDDYELTVRYHSLPLVARLRPEYEADGIDFSKVETFFSTPRAVMAVTLAGLRERHGGVESYLTGPAGLSAEQVSSLRGLLLAQ